MITRTVDGNVFKIKSSGNVVSINGFPITVDQWNQAVAGKRVKLVFQGRNAILTSKGSNVMFNRRSLTTGKHISTMISSSSSSSSNSNSNISGTGN